MGLDGIKTVVCNIVHEFESVTSGADQAKIQDARDSERDQPTKAGHEQGCDWEAVLYRWLHDPQLVRAG